MTPDPDLDTSATFLVACARRHRLAGRLDDAEYTLNSAASLYRAEGVKNDNPAYRHESRLLLYARLDDNARILEELYRDQMVELGRLSARSPEEVLGMEAEEDE